jgi:hypothetical protein
MRETLITTLAPGGFGAYLGMDAPLNKFSIESKIIEFGVRSKKLWLFSPR